MGIERNQSGRNQTHRQDGFPVLPPNGLPGKRPDRFLIVQNVQWQTLQGNRCFRRWFDQTVCPRLVCLRRLGPSESGCKSWKNQTNASRIPMYLIAGDSKTPQPSVPKHTNNQGSTCLFSSSIQGIPVTFSAVGPEIVPKNRG